METAYVPLGHVPLTFWSLAGGGRLKEGIEGLLLDEFACSVGDGFAGPDERNCSHSELSGEGSWHRWSRAPLSEADQSAEGGSALE